MLTVLFFCFSLFLNAHQFLENLNRTLRCPFSSHRISERRTDSDISVCYKGHVDIYVSYLVDRLIKNLSHGGAPPLLFFGFFRGRTLSSSSVALRLVPVSPFRFM